VKLVFLLEYHFIKSTLNTKILALMWPIRGSIAGGSGNGILAMA
jgi:hypothetical protein